MYRKLSISIWGVFLAGVIGIPLVLTSIYYNWFGWYGGMPDLKVLENPKTELASEVYSADGVQIGKYWRENRSQVEYEEISSNMLNALVATEDVRFEQHSGIDLESLVRVAVGIITFNQQGGGSTLSQQLARNLFETRSTLHNGTLCDVPLLGKFIIKMKEWILAVKIEKSYTKKEIITMYLNTVDFGSNAFGIKVASNTFFSVEPDSLEIPQAAVLVGLLKAPTYYSPKLNPDNSLRRRNVVMNQMRKNGFLSDTKYDSLTQTPIGIEEYNVESHNTGLATYFRSELAKELREWCRTHFKPNGEPYDLYADGLKVYTTIDSRMQQHAEEAIQEHMARQQGLFFTHWKGRNPWINEDYEEIRGFLDKAVRQTPRYQSLKRKFGDNKDSIQHYLNKKVPMRVFTWETPTHEIDTLLSPRDSVRYYKHFLHAGMMAMDPFNGHIKAWVGGIKHKYFKFDHVRQSMRQPGSTFKPIIYSAAIEENKLHPCFRVVDAPITFSLPSGDVWTPKNSSEYSGATFTLRQAMALSKNTVAAYLMKELTPERVGDFADYKFGFDYLRTKYGVDQRLERVPSLCLGTSDVSLFELVSAYTPFVNGGVWTEPIFITRIEDKDGKVLETFVPKIIESLSEETAYIMTYMLRGSNEERGGTSMGLRSRNIYPDDNESGYRFIRDNEVGGKTGTTSNYSDAWFIGVTKDLIAGVWSGGEETSIHFRSLTYGQGGRQAMPAYGIFMDKVFADKSLGYTKGEFPKPNQPLPELDCWKYEQKLTNANDSTGNYILPTKVDDDEFM